MAEPNTLRRTLLISAALCGSAGLAVALTPRPQRFMDNSQRLADLVPQRFGRWRLAELAPGLVSPDVASSIAGLYSETLARTYIRDDGQMIMLSLAYGENQTRESQIHKPEVCYAAQGFAIQGLTPESVRTRQREIPVMRVLANMQSRQEPITYWIRSGKYTVRGWKEQNYARLVQGLQGVIPDGLLVRVSSISNDTAAAYRLQDAFIQDMLDAVAPDKMPLLLGQPI